MMGRYYNEDPALSNIFPTGFGPRSTSFSGSQQASMMPSMPVQTQKYMSPQTEVLGVRPGGIDQGGFEDFPVNAGQVCAGPAIQLAVVQPKASFATLLGCAASSKNSPSRLAPTAGAPRLGSVLFALEKRLFDCWLSAIHKAMCSTRSKIIPDVGTVTALHADRRMHAAGFEFSISSSLRVDQCPTCVYLSTCLRCSVVRYSLWPYIMQSHYHHSTILGSSVQANQREMSL